MADDRVPLLGVHSHLFRGSPVQVAAACRDRGLTCVQLTPAFPGLSFHQPGQVTTARCRLAVEPFHAAGIRIAGVTGGANLMDPDLEFRHRGLVRLHTLIRHCRDFSTDKVVVETGSLNPRSPCRIYSANQTDEAWDPLHLILREALRVAAAHGVTLLLKPGPTHVLASVEDALRLHEELAHPNLGFVMDPASFLVHCPVVELDRHLEQLWTRLGGISPLVHAKDIRHDARQVATPRAGAGVLDYGLFARLLRQHQPRAPVILEHLRPEDVATTRAFILRCSCAL